MVTFGVLAAVKALKCGDGAAQQRRVVYARRVLNPSPSVYTFSGKAFRQSLLVCTQNIDGVVHGARHHGH